MLSDTLRAAMEDATARIAEIKIQLEKLDALRDEKDRLERFCEITLTCLNRGVMVPPVITASELTKPFLPDSITSRISPVEDRLWKTIHLVMEMQKAPMTAGEVLEALEKYGVKLSGTTKRETVRSSILRKSDMFERVGRGLFALSEWSNHIKQLRNGETGDEEDMAQGSYGHVTFVSQSAKAKEM